MKGPLRRSMGVGRTEDMTRRGDQVGSRPSSPLQTARGDCGQIKEAHLDLGHAPLASCFPK